MYAIIMTGGKQYRVSEGDVLSIEKVAGEPGSAVEFKDVLLVKSDEKTYLGRPRVEGAVVKGTVEDNGRGVKVLVFKYKAKKQYKRTRGHRQDFSRVRIESITVGQ